MNKSDRKELCRYIRSAADDLGLRDWTLMMALSSGIDDDADGFPQGCKPIGSNNSEPGSKRASIWISDDAHEWDQEKLKHTVAHELLHCHVAPAWHQVQDDLHGKLGQEAYDIFTDSFRRNMETAVDGMAEAWAEGMPDIRWPSKRRR